MRKYLFLLFSVITVFILSLPAFSENFYIDEYKVAVMVADNGDMDVKEVIDAYFTTPSHGIVREIPISYELNYPDGTSIQSGARISEFSVNDRSEKYYNGSSYMVRIGNPDRLISGPKKYVITYKLKPKTRKKNVEDEFYYNIIGTGWAVPIKKVAFKVTMPKDFDKSKAGLSIGKYGSAGFNENADFYSDGKSVWSYINTPLEPYEGVNLRIALGDNYYSNNETGHSSRDIVLFLICAFTAVSFVLWLIFGKDDPVIPVVNFYPPKDKNSALAGAQYHGDADTEEIVSLIIYLASKGYIKIENPDGDFVLTKIKEYDGNDTFEKDLFDAIFREGDKVTKRMLGKSPYFYQDCDDIIKNLDEEIKYTVFDPNACTPVKIIIMLVCITAIIALTLYSLFYYSVDNLKVLFSSENLFILSFIVIAIIVAISGLTSKKALFVKIFVVLWAAGFGGIPMLFFYFDNKDLFFDPDWLVISTGIIGLMISIVCLVNLPKRNKYGQKILGQLAGLKKFIETARKDEIERLTMENPGYCFDILPYAYVFGCAATWINKMENIFNYSSPDWYQGHFNAHAFSSFASSMRSVSIPSYSNGGISHSSHSSGGGGFSGGGHGGGGGHSW